ncbi:hypothetical protein K438DRAFT_1765960 [Mycena galopus ATCC 62051]|nr:hypothetical protein K438DRAFT_1765960 [Mycena galopus ATCC 62051]
MKYQTTRKNYGSSTAPDLELVWCKQISLTLVDGYERRRRRGGFTGPYQKPGTSCGASFTRLCLKSQIRVWWKPVIKSDSVTSAVPQESPVCKTIASRPQFLELPCSKPLCVVLCRLRSSGCLSRDFKVKKQVSQACHSAVCTTSDPAVPTSLQSTPDSHPNYAKERTVQRMGSLSFVTPYSSAVLFGTSPDAPAAPRTVTRPVALLAFPTLQAHCGDTQQECNPFV